MRWNARIWRARLVRMMCSLLPAATPPISRQATLDEAAIRAAADSTGDAVSAYAVAAHFATRNPAHESRARDIIRDVTGCPVTCNRVVIRAWQAAPRCDGRAECPADQSSRPLVAATESIMAELSLDCPLMVVKGDGSLIGAHYARSRPVETVLSGRPPASPGRLSRRHADSHGGEYRRHNHRYRAAAEWRAAAQG